MILVAEMSWVYFVLLAIATNCCSADAKPNVVIFLVDDLGIGDIGCFGNDTIKTPNIDKLASEGVRLTHNLAPESVCTPSRAAFLTGRYAIRSGLASNPKRIRMFLFLSVPGGLPQNETTFAEVLRDEGYATGFVGKWHLGLNLKTSTDFHFHPNRHGFQHFYGLPLTNLRECKAGAGSVIEFKFPNARRNFGYSLMIVTLTGVLCCLGGLISKRSAFLLGLFSASLYGCFLLALEMRRYGVCVLMRDYEVVEQPIILENLTARLTDDAIDFVEQNHKQPFLLFMSYVKVHTVLFTTKQFQDHSVHGKYGDNVEEMDWSVGQIMSTLQNLGIQNNTFVYFTSDHGPYFGELYAGERHGGWKGIYKGGKGQSWEGGIRVPTIVSWPSHIKPGISISEPTNSFDIFPTVVDIAGASIPQDRVIDGKNLLPLLKQEKQLSPHEFMFHYCAKEIHAVRYRPRHGLSTWKAHFKTHKWVKGTQGCTGICHACYGDEVNSHDPPLLFDITTDPTESHPIDPHDATYKEVIKKIKAATEEHKSSVDDVPNQLDLNVLWCMTALQPCCNFPFCSCTENTTVIHYPKELGQN